MMILWATEGIKYHLSEYARFIGEDGTFFDKFGKTAFEGYVMHMLDVSKRQYIPEQEVIVGKNKELTADFILLEGDKALIMECKTRRGSLEHRYGIIEAIDADYEKTIIKGLHQCVCTEKLIRNGILDLSQYPELQGVSEFSYAVVTHDIFYQANSRLMQDRVREKMGEDIQYQVLSARELELILANIAKNGIIQFIAAKSVKSYLMPESYENYLRLWIDKRGDSNMNDPSQDICLALAERSRFYIEKMLRPTQQLPAFPF
jgi:hypothetical protein